jgi:hydroxyacylglutathione hydrolase
MFNSFLSESKIIESRKAIQGNFFIFTAFNPDKFAHFHMGNIKINRFLAGRSFIYIIQQDNNFIIVDTGMKGHAEKSILKLQEFGIRPGALKLIILTHTHYDHSGGAQRIRKWSGAALAVHSSEAEYLQNGYTPLPKGSLLLTRFISWLGRKSNYRQAYYPPVIADVIFEDQLDLVPYGIDGKVIPTPGHTKGSASVILDNHKAIVGDTLFGIRKGSVFPVFADNITELYKSWEKLIRCGCTIFFPGHGKAVRLQDVIKDYEKRTGRPAPETLSKAES